jgi:2'-5' RNA ligase
VRLFVAVVPSSEAVEHLRVAAAELAVSRAQAGLIRPELWHLTVTFLGESAEERLAAITAAVGAGAAAGRAGTLALAGGGRFGEAVLWAGVTGDVDAVARTARAVGREVRKARVALERRPYRPHLTLARPRQRITKEALRADVERLAAYRGPNWAADQVHLMRSDFLTTSTGQLVNYEPLASWPIGG